MKNKNSIFSNSKNNTEYLFEHKAYKKLILKLKQEINTTNNITNDIHLSNEQDFFSGSGDNLNYRTQ